MVISYISRNHRTADTPLDLLTVSVWGAVNFQRSRQPIPIYTNCIVIDFKISSYIHFWNIKKLKFKIDFEIFIQRFEKLPMHEMTALICVCDGIGIRPMRQQSATRHFRLQLIYDWNSRSPAVTMSASLSSFKRNLKTELFARSYPDVYDLHNWPSYYQYILLFTSWPRSSHELRSYLTPPYFCITLHVETELFCSAVLIPQHYHWYAAMIDYITGGYSYAEWISRKRTESLVESYPVHGHYNTPVISACWTPGKITVIVLTTVSILHHGADTDINEPTNQHELVRIACRYFARSSTWHTWQTSLKRCTTQPALDLSPSRPVVP